MMTTLRISESTHHEVCFDVSIVYAYALLTLAYCVCIGQPVTKLGTFPQVSYITVA